jgi:hypothetical protein
MLSKDYVLIMLLCPPLIRVKHELYLISYRPSNICVDLSRDGILITDMRSDNRPF